ncbi:MAG: DNA/RNA non-specific endonuclease [Sulfuricurvum sp.]|jgi:endonuclease G
MQITKSIFITIALSITLYASPTQCDNIYYGNEAPDIVNVKLSSKTKELCYSTFAVMHSGVSRTPLYVGEHLTRVGLGSKSQRTNDFHPEERLPLDERAELNDYARSGYDRGHMAPAADMSSQQAEHECFTLANMIPQNQENNRGIWAHIEAATRNLAKDRGELYVITGPIFMGSNLQRIGGRVLIPTKIYKAIYDPSSGFAGAYIVDNANGNNYQVISIAQLEQLSGLKLFPKLSDSAKHNAMRLPEPSGKHGNNLGEVNGPVPTLYKTSHTAPSVTNTQECKGKKTCREMSSCEEAKFYLNNCGVTRIDGDGDGIPCEKLCR